MFKNLKKLVNIIGPGILVAATGVGAGDLLTAGLGGAAIGTAILWAALAGAILKAILNEGIARWQLATGTTLLEGWVNKLGKGIQWAFLFYFLGWSILTGGALVTACGVAGSGLFPVSDNAEISKVFWGIFHSLLGLFLIRFGGFRIFEKLMMFCISIMFITVIFTASLSQPDWTGVIRGMVLPSIPRNGLGWTLGIMGGVGGTVTLLSYGYWIREKNRMGYSDLRTCRIDLSVAYCLTALFGVAMILIGSKVTVSGGGEKVSLIFAQQLELIIGSAGKLTFLIGFWGAVFSSLLGVWQSAPYIFADFLRLKGGEYQQKKYYPDLKKENAYKYFQVIIAVGSLPILFFTVKQAQLTYAVFGAFFMPFLAFTLLLMNNRKDWVGSQFRNGILTNIFLGITLVFFLMIGISQAIDKLKLIF